MTKDRHLIYDKIAMDKYTSAIKYKVGDILQFWENGHSWPAKIISVKKVDGLYYYELG